MQPTAASALVTSTGRLNDWPLPWYFNRVPSNPMRSTIPVAWTVSPSGWKSVNLTEELPALMTRMAMETVNPSAGRKHDARPFRRGPVFRVWERAGGGVLLPAPRGFQENRSVG